MSMNPGRNAPCPCGSGKKYKHCCAGKTAPRTPTPVEFNQLAVLFNSGCYAELESRTRLLLEQYPASGLGWKLMCAALQMQGKDALRALQKAADFLPNDAEAHNNLGSALQDLGQLEAAVTNYRQVLKSNSNDAEVHNNLGTALHDLGQFDKAVTSYRQALKIKPNYAEAYNNLGIALQDLGQLDAAVASYRQALKIKPDYAEAYCGLGIALKNLGLPDDAVASFHRALEIKPDYAEVHTDLGNALLELGQLDAALASYRRALEIKPDYVEAHRNYSYLLLSLGDFERGWQEYEWRLTSVVCQGNPVDPRTQLPLPRASSLLPFTSKDKRILLFHEQGIGDELFFLRFAPQLREEAQWVAYLPTDKVRSLIERSGCVDQVISRTDKDLAFDSVIRVGDLPLLLGCHSIEAIPQTLRLLPNEQSVAKVHQHLRESGLANQRLLGVTWRAGLAPVPGQRKTLFKQIDLDLLANSIKDWNGAIVVLQRAPAAGEIEQLRANVSCPVYDLSEYNNDLESMLALLDELDEYVGVSNANMHLMAGLGKTARVLIPSPAEWRWMAGGDESPWFPGFKLYRELIDGGWGQAMVALEHDLSSALV